MVSRPSTWPSRPQNQIISTLCCDTIVLSKAYRQEAAMSKRPHNDSATEPDLEDLQSDPRQHTSNRNVRDATGTKPASTEAAEQPLNKFSRTITQSKSQGGSQAMLYATGMTEGDMDKPQV